jgi:tetratricopeptide (TPR) repeat protein
MYDLDESLLAPTGSQVQCTKCQHVFTAFPPQAAGRTLVGVPAQPSPEVTRSEPPAAERRPKATGAAAAPSAPVRPNGAQPRAARAGPAPVYRPSHSAPPVGRSPALRRDSVGTFEARLRSTARWKWLAPVLAAAFVVTGAGAWYLLSSRRDPDARRAHGEALALMALDDAASLERASAQLTDTIRRAHGLVGTAAADRALSLVLRASALGDEGEALASRAAARSDERDRLVREQSAGWEAAERTMGSEAVTLDAEVRRREEQANVLGRNAFEAIRAAQADAGDTPEVARALALHHASRGERERALGVLLEARRRGTKDPWLELAEAWVDARDPDRAARERAATKLAALASARPELLRGRYLLARAQASLGRKPEALATVDSLLAANPKHERARELRQHLAEPAGGQAPVPPPAVKAPSQPRKMLSQPGEGGGAPILEETPGTSPSPAAPRPARVRRAAPPPPPATAAEAQPEPPAAPAAQPEPPPAPAPEPPPPPPPPQRRAPRTFEPESEPSFGG